MNALYPEYLSDPSILFCPSDRNIEDHIARAHKGGDPKGEWCVHNGPRANDPDSCSGAVDSSYHYWGYLIDKMGPNCLVIDNFYGLSEYWKYEIEHLPDLTQTGAQASLIIAAARYGAQGTGATHGPTPSMNKDIIIFGHEWSLPWLIYHSQCFYDYAPFVEDGEEYPFEHNMAIFYLANGSWRFCDYFTGFYAIRRLRQGIERFATPPSFLETRWFAGEAPLGWDLLTDRFYPKSVFVMYDKVTPDPYDMNHMPPGFNVLYMDGHVEFQKFDGDGPAPCSDRMANLVRLQDCTKLGNYVTRPPDPPCLPPDPPDPPDPPEE